MKNNKILVVSLAGAIVAGLAVAVFAALMHGGGPRYRSQAELLKGMPAAAKAELQARGKRLTQPLVCQSMPEATRHRLLVRCTGTTVDDKPIQVFGAALPKRKAEYYTILVAGEPLVKNAACLGADCRGD